MLKISNVSKSYGDNQILQDINLKVKKNKITGLAGQSGCGKSTLLRCIQKLDNIDTGSIICDGEIGFMFQDFQLFPHMTVLANLIYAPMLHENLSNHQEHANTLLKNLGMIDKANVYPNQLSGGQKQRVALARSLMMCPDLLLCDEPTSGLDMATILDVISLLKSVREMGITMIIASHDLDFLTKIADNIILLQGGRLVTSIDPSSIKDPITYLNNHCCYE